MPAISFSIAKDKILSGEKRQTIRGDRKISIKKGDKLFLYWKQQSAKHCEKLGEATCTSVQKIAIFGNSYVLNPWTSKAKIFHSTEELDEFAIADGFDNWQELIKFFEDNYSLSFTGNLIMWDEIVKNMSEIQSNYLDAILFPQVSAKKFALNNDLFKNPDNRIEYKSFWIECEYPNGGLLGISVMNIPTKAWWSFPCDMEGIEPFFGSADSDKAIAWIKSVIDNIPKE